MASENNEIFAATQNSSDESDYGKQEPTYEVKVGRGFTEERFDDGSLVRSCGIDFSFCTKTGAELIDLIERSFTIVFEELMGDEDNLNLDKINGIFRYDMKSEALNENEWFGWNEPNFKPTSYETIIQRIMSRVESERVMAIFRSRIMVSMLYTPKK